MGKPGAYCVKIHGIFLLPLAQSVKANLSYSITPHKTLYILEVSDFHHS